MSFQRGALLVVLNYIHRQEDIKKSFLELGYSSIQIDLLLNQLVGEGLIEIDTHGKFILTEKGINQIELFANTNIQDWIQPENKSKTSKIKKNSVFLPSRDELSF